MTRCVDCPELPNGTRKRLVCCRREALKVGDIIPLPPRKLDVRPTFTGPGKTSFKPARHANRGLGK